MWNNHKTTVHKHSSSEQTEHELLYKKQWCAKLKEINSKKELKDEWMSVCSQFCAIWCWSSTYIDIHIFATHCMSSFPFLFLFVLCLRGLLLYSRFTHYKNPCTISLNEHVFVRASQTTDRNPDLCLQVCVHNIKKNRCSLFGVNEDVCLWNWAIVVHCPTYPGSLVLCIF